MYRHVALLAVIGCGDNLVATSEVTLAPDVDHPGAAIPADFLGASYETSTVIGGAYFRADNAPLLAMFHTLGIASLRLGGNEAELGPEPATADIGAAMAFVDAANVALIYTLRLGTFDPVAAAATTQLVLGTPGLACFSLGNEGIGIASYDDYVTKATAYIAAIDARARYCAPDMFDPTWMTRFAAVLAPTGQLAAADLHAYFGGDGTLMTGAVARDWLLSPAIVDDYANNQAAFAADLAALGAPFRLSETNSYFNGGSLGASDTFASALWVVDYLHWWAAHDAAGVNLHTGDHVSGAATLYSLFTTSPAGYAVHPIGYGVKAFDLGGHGRIVPLSIDSDELAAYAVLDDTGSLVVTIINKTHDTAARDISVSIVAGEHAHAEMWTLAAGGDVAVTTGVTLGGAAIDDGGGWLGAASPIAIIDDAARLFAPAASVVVVRLE